MSLRSVAIPPFDSFEKAGRLRLLQSYLLLGEEQYLSMFAEAYVAAMTRMRLGGDYARFGWLVDVHVDTGAVSHVFISSLSAFWPGMQALVGACVVVWFRV